jgi:hypothetical protein
MVELAQTVLWRGLPALVQAVDHGSIHGTAEGKLASRIPEGQEALMTEIAAGKPVVQARATAGVREREPPDFDDKGSAAGA